MRDPNEIRKEMTLGNRHQDKLIQEYQMSQLTKRLSYAAGAIAKNGALCEALTSLPCDEARIVLEEVIQSEEFSVAFNRVMNESTRLSKVRRDKYERAEKRKAKRELQKTVRFKDMDTDSSISSSYEAAVHENGTDNTAEVIRSETASVADENSYVNQECNALSFEEADAAERVQQYNMTEDIPPSDQAYEQYRSDMPESTETSAPSDVSAEGVAGET